MVTFLACLGYKKQILSFDQYKQQYLDQKFYGKWFTLFSDFFGSNSITKVCISSIRIGFISSCIIQPLLLNEATSDADIEALTMGDERSMEYKRLLYSSPKVRDNIRKLIPIYDSLGIFDWFGRLFNTFNKVYISHSFCS